MIYSYTGWGGSAGSLTQDLAVQQLPFYCYTKLLKGYSGGAKTNNSFKRQSDKTSRTLRWPCIFHGANLARRLHEAEFVSWVVYITLNGKFEAFSIRFLIVELSNMATKNVQDASLAPDQNLTGSQYRATWSFRFGLNILQNGTGTDVEDGGAGVGGTDVEDALQNIFLQKKPDRVSNIEARYTVVALSAACNASSDPNARTLPVEGYIQLSKAKICLHDLDRWVPNAEWTPVLGRLTDNADYKKYKDSKADTSVYIHKQIHGTPALGKGGGSKPKAGKVSP